MTDSMIGDARIATLFGLHGRRALVTGAASGIGKGIAELFLHAGAAVMIADLDGDGAGAVAARFRDTIGSGATVHAVRADVSDEASTIAMFAETEARLGGVDIVVNNAGIYFSRPLVDLSVEEWDRIHAINLRGVFLGMREAVKRMKPAGGGVILNMSSSNALNAVVFDHMHYGSSKAAVNALTRSAALEFAGDNIRVNSILPGATATEGGARMRASGAMQFRGPVNDPARMPLGKRGEPLDVAAAALYLCSDAARIVTGVTLSVDAGYHIS